MVRGASPLSSLPVTPFVSTSSNITEEPHMPEYAVKRDANRCPTHPGELLRDIIPATGKTKVEIAALLGISRQHLYDLLAERKPVSPAIAARLGKLFGDGAGVWIRMQGAYDTWHAERDLAPELKKIPTLRSAAA
jgi:addiction module HigA family antidote